MNILSKIVLCLLLFGIFGLTGFPAYADFVVNFQQGQNGYMGSLAVSIDAENPEDNDIGDIELFWDGPSDWVLLRFDDLVGEALSQIPPGSTIVNAEVIYTITNGGDPANVHELLVEFIDGSWNDQPFLTAGSLTLEPGTHVSSDPVATAPGSGPRGLIEITSTVQKWVNGELPNNGIAFAPTGGNGVGILNPNAPPIPTENRPRLVVQTPIGEFTFEDGVNGYQGTVDTWTEISIPLRDIGRDTRVLIDGSIGDPSWGFLRFDDLFGSGPGQIPPGTQINDARIEISIFNPGNFFTVHDMNPDIEYNELSRNEAQSLGLLPTNVATMGNPRSVAGTGQETIAGIDFINDPTQSEKIIANFYDSDAFLEIPAALSVPEVPEEIIPNIADENQNPPVQFPDPEKQPTFFDPTVLDIVPSGFGGNTSINVTSSLQRYSNGEPNNGWFLFHEGAFGDPGDGVEFRSSEWSQPAPPTLTVITSAGQFTFINGQNGYNGVVDTHIDGTLADQAFGEDDSLITDGLVSEFGEISTLIRFDGILGTGPNQIPPGTEILSANLSLVTTEQGGGTRIYDLPSDASFDETTTWNQFVSTVGDPVELYTLNEEAVALQQNPDVGSGAKLDMNVTSSVQSYSDGSPNAGWIIVPLIPFLDPGVSTGGLGKGDDALSYISSEGGELVTLEPQPLLRVTVAGDPPSTSVQDFMIYE